MIALSRTSQQSKYDFTFSFHNSTGLLTNRLGILSLSFAKICDSTKQLKFEPGRGAGNRLYGLRCSADTNLQGFLIKKINKVEFLWGDFSRSSTRTLECFQPKLSRHSIFLCSSISRLRTNRLTWGESLSTHPIRTADCLSSFNFWRGMSLLPWPKTFKSVLRVSSWFKKFVPVFRSPNTLTLVNFLWGRFLYTHSLAKS